MPNRWGLSNLLQAPSGNDHLHDRPVWSKTQIPGLCLLPSGTRSSRISSLLSSARTAELLERVKKEFDAILIDTPPMMQVSDARVLALMADAVVLVVRAGQTTRDTAKAAVERLTEDGSHVLGTVLNGWDPNTNGYGCYDTRV